MSEYNSTVQSDAPFLDATSLNKLCPVLLYQLVAPTSKERQGCVLPATIDTHSNEHPHFESSHNYHHHNENQNMLFGTYLKYIII